MVEYIGTELRLRNSKIFGPEIVVTKYKEPVTEIRGGNKDIIIEFGNLHPDTYLQMNRWENELDNPWVDQAFKVTIIEDTGSIIRVRVENIKR